MSDNLRDRIVAVLNSFPADMRPVAVVNIEKAEAVIRELGLRQELRYPNRLPHYTFMPPQRTRYVTEWES